MWRGHDPCCPVATFLQFLTNRKRVNIFRSSYSSNLVTECVHESAQQWIVNLPEHLAVSFSHDPIHVIQKVVQDDQ